MFGLTTAVRPGEHNNLQLLHAVSIFSSFPDVEPLAVSKIDYVNGGFPLFWQSDANTTCGYVVEWNDAFCMQQCPVEWIKLAAGDTNVTVESCKPSIKSPEVCENDKCLYCQCSLFHICQYT